MAQVYVKDVSFASTTLAVTTAVISVSSLSAGVVTGVEWPSSSSAAGPFLPTPSHQFTLGVVGWVAIRPRHV